MREYLDVPQGDGDHDESVKRLALQKMAFAVAWRILEATPINATSLVSALLLTTRGVALTLNQVHHTLQDSLDYLHRKGTPVTESTRRLRTLDGVQSALDALSGATPSPASTGAANRSGGSRRRTSTRRRSTAIRSSMRSWRPRSPNWR